LVALSSRSNWRKIAYQIDLFAVAFCIAVETFVSKNRERVPQSVTCLALVRSFRTFEPLNWSKIPHEIDVFVDAFDVASEFLTAQTSENGARYIRCVGR